MSGLITKVVSFIVNKVLARFNGLKTYIGLAGTGLAFVLDKLLPFLQTDLPSVAAKIPAGALHILEAVFGWLVALGLAHKADKAIVASTTAANASIMAGPVVGGATPQAVDIAPSTITIGNLTPRNPLQN
jgi:hypothetical protein